MWSLPWLDLVGWSGSALLVYSVMQARLLRFRALNLVASAVLAAFNAALGIWPMVAMNVVLCLINAWHLRHLLSTRHDEAAYAVLEVAPDDAYLQHVLAVHRADIRRYQPDFGRADPGEVCYLILRGDETVGVVVIADEGDGVARVLLDYVTPRYRDFTPGAFVFRDSGALQRRGYRAVLTSPRMVGAYYAQIGFQRLPGGGYELRW